MSKTIVVAGFGPGISTGVAETFGRQGFSVALVARSADKLEKGVAALAAKGIKAQGFAADLGKASEVSGVVGKVRAALGPIHAIHWNAYTTAAGDLLTASAEDLQNAVGIATVSLHAAVIAALEDLKATKGAVLVTNGGFGLPVDAVDEAGVNFKSSGLSIANAAKHKLVRLLGVQLAGDGVFVGEVMVTGQVKGTAWDNGNATLEPSFVGEAFWKLYAARGERRVKV